MSDEIDYQRVALVHLLADDGGQGGEGPIWAGTLAAAVCRVMAMTAEEQLRVRIVIEKRNMHGTTLSGIKEIAELHRLPQFPREGLTEPHRRPGTRQNPRRAIPHHPRAVPAALWPVPVPRPLPGQ